MWKEMCKDYGLDESNIDLTNSIFVGDAGGRKAYLKGGKAVPKDFSCSDRNLAENIGIPFKTPEEFFLGENPRDFARDFDLINFPFRGENEVIKFEKKNEQELAIFCGPPGAGKSTFFWKHLKPLGFERVNQDLLKRCVVELSVAHVVHELTGSIAKTSASKQLRSFYVTASRL
jgi:bifunctional polynucleotide phosphatase/kinase